MYILGYDIDFGHLEAVNLISSTKYSEKQVVSGVSRGAGVDATSDLTLDNENH
jgi:hypothetical protein